MGIEQALPAQRNQQQVTHLAHPPAQSNGCFHSVQRSFMDYLLLQHSQGKASHWILQEETNTVTLSLVARDILKEYLG